MPVRGTIHYVGSPEQKLKGFPRAVKTANFAAVDLWHSRFLPLHFRLSAVATYGYRKRTKKYMRRKARSKGHQRPLVFSGRLERNARRQIRITGTSKQARGLMPGTQVANFHEMRDEMTSVTEHEIRVLADHHAAVLTSELKKIKPRRSKRV